MKRNVRLKVFDPQAAVGMQQHTILDLGVAKIYKE